jgi:hypothetical protein
VQGRQSFNGQIAGVGSTSGTRVVVGRWTASPFGAFADVMLEQADGHRVLVAPTPQVAEFVADTYVFDEVVVSAVGAAVTLGRAGSPEGSRWDVRAGDLAVRFAVGGRAPLGRLLRAVPGRVADSTIFATLVDPVARVALRGVRTHGQARSGRREWYAAHDLHRVTSLTGRWRGTDLGALAPVEPPCRFGFSSTPRTPGVTAVVTTVESLG